MFTLLINHIARFSSLFKGRKGHIVSAYNLSHLNAREYYLAGKIIATSSVYGCGAPYCFSQTVAEYIFMARLFLNPILRISNTMQYSKKSSR